jgi:hypothetical protein
VQHWAPHITAQLERFGGGASQSDVYETCGLFNNASLLFALAGDDVFAEEICIRQMDWLAGLQAKGGVAEVASLAMQPWVNLGRLYRQRRQWDRALAQFADIFDPDPDGVLHFGAFAVHAWDVRHEDAALLYAVDSLRTLAMAGRHEHGLRFIRRLRPGTTSTVVLTRLDEYEFQLLLHRGFATAAARVLERSNWTLHPHTMLINAFYRCLMLEASGTDSDDVLLELAQWASRTLAADQAPDHNILRYALELSRFLVRLQRHERAGGLIAAGYRAATVYEDVPLRYDFAVLARNLGCTGGGIPQSSESVLTGSNYAGYARRYGVDVDLTAEAASALDALQRKIHALIG